jgi:hypothetical protein
MMIFAYIMHVTIIGFTVYEFRIGDDDFENQLTKFQKIQRDGLYD